MKKMDFEEFKTMVKEQIKNYLPEDYSNAEVIEKEIEKIGTRYSGLIVKKEAETVSRIFKLDDYYRDYVHGTSEDTLLDKIAKAVIDSETGRDYGWLQVYEKVKNQLFMRVNNKEAIKHLLNKVPHTEIEDLVITYHINVEVSGANSGNAMVHNEMMEHYGITLEQLHADTLASRNNFDPMQVIKMGDLFPEAAGDRPPMTVIRQENMGAAILFYPEAMKQIAKELGGYFILPSSIHEFILIPDDKEVEVDALEKIVQEVNKMLLPEEWLSDHVYHYDAVEGAFEMASHYVSRKAKAEVKNNKATGIISDNERSFAYEDAGSFGTGY